MSRPAFFTGHPRKQDALVPRSPSLDLRFKLLRAIRFLRGSGNNDQELTGLQPRLVFQSPVLRDA